MYEKRKTFLLMFTLIVLFISISAVSASNITDNQAQTSLNDNTIQTDSSSTIQTNSVTSDNSAIETQNIKVDKKSIEKEKTTKKDDSTNKTVKKATRTITDGNYQRYFTSDGTLDRISANDTIILNGAFSNRTFYLDKEGLTLIGLNATLDNSQIFIGEDAQYSTVKNITIIGRDKDTAIYNEADNINISNNNVSVINSHVHADESLSQGIANTATNVTISNNIVNVKGHGYDIDWTGGDRPGLAGTIGILTQGGDNVLIENNTVTAGRLDDCIGSYYSTIYGIALDQGNNVTINNNSASVTGARFLYSLNALNAISNIVLSNNTLYAAGDRYTDGIQIGNGATNCTVVGNKITGICYNDTIFTADNEAMAYGIITTNMGMNGQPTVNMTVLNNEIQLNSTIVYGMEIYTTKNSTIDGNTVNGVGNYTMGMSLAHSSGMTVVNNKFNTTGNSTTYINEIVQEIRPANTGIQIQQNSDNTTVINNTIYTTDIGNDAKGICINETSNLLVTNNTVTANNLTGDNAIIVAKTTDNGTTNVTVTNNTAPILKENNANVQLILPSNPQLGTNITLTAYVTDSVTNNPIDGKLVFKFNGVTRKDANGNPLKLDVINGTATLNYSLIGFSGRNYTVTAVFANSSYNRAENTTILSIQKVNVNYTAKNMRAYAGETILINETLYDENGNILYGNGKVAIKVNGKTIAHANIKNGVLCTNVTLPFGLRNGTHTFTIVIGGNGRYNEVRTNSTITILKQDAKVEIIPIYSQAGGFITFNASVITNATNTPVTGGTYVFKINGKTITNTNEMGEILPSVQRLNNGNAIAQTYLDAGINNGVYNITFVYSGSNQVNPIRLTVPYLTIRT